MQKGMPSRSEDASEAADIRPLGDSEIDSAAGGEFSTPEPLNAPLIPSFEPEDASNWGHRTLPSLWTTA